MLKKETCFFSADAASYKNHSIIVDACKILKSKNISNYRIVLTIAGNETKLIKTLKKVVDYECLPIRFIGRISKTQVYEYYSKSILIFPSYIETFGLPLLEARIHQSPILASDCPFSREILHDYDKVSYFLTIYEYEGIIL
ncbi:glycosyltransferase [Gallicola sp. Sow4_E12]|uniref:glycosyltransferase n=1 Tax=Gallicola sp. Sow4_E12 TaxID=3438785 RepID=UPI003F91B8EA